MKILLIDNYDSFTYNLYQYIAEVAGREPIVHRNDELDADRLSALDIDGIVVSPGPGRPQVPSDLGCSRDAILQTALPVLGVCLGHQAIAHLYGAEVGLAPEPRHGRTSLVYHDGSDLFAGIPSPFEVVRYHSLVASELAPPLRATAYADDGTLMALAHSELPMWGVQFHPESVCSTFGRELLRNFCHSAERFLTARGRVRRESGPGRRVGYEPQPRPKALYLHTRAVHPAPDSAVAFEALLGRSATSFWLDSATAPAAGARFSYMGDASGPRAHVLRYACRSQRLTIDARGETRDVTTRLLPFLREQLAETEVVAPDDLPFAFRGGYVGYLGYELKAEIDGDLHHDAPQPDAALVFADRFIAIDHESDTAFAVCLADAELDPASRRWLDETAAALASLATEPPTLDAQADPTGDAGAIACSWREPLSSYEELVRRAQEEIRQGETYEVCLTNELRARAAIDVGKAYIRLRARNPAPFAALLRFDRSLSVLSASPELFLALDRERMVTTKPIKGTAPRGTTPEEDRAIAERLRSSEKDRSENLMIADLLRNDLNRVCEVGSVTTPELFAVESFASVHQLVTTVRGRLRAERDAIDLLEATFPGGSMTGAPKIRTMRIIDELESGARGVYSGSIGYLSLDGTMKLSIVIRTIVARGDELTIGAGGAVVALSDPAAEVAEIELKAKAQVDLLASVIARG